MSMLSQIIERLPSAYDVVEQGGGCWSILLADVRSDGGNLDVIFLQMEMGLVEVACIHFEVLFVFHVADDGLGVVCPYHPPFLACFAQHDILFIDGVNEIVVRQFGPIAFNGNGINSFVLVPISAPVVNLCALNVSSHASSHKLDVLLHQFSTMLATVDVVEHGIRQQVVLQHIEQHVWTTALSTSNKRK